MLSIISITAVDLLRYRLLPIDGVLVRNITQPLSDKLSEEDFYHKFITCYFIY